jgi:hypothetical protein
MIEEFAASIKTAVPRPGRAPTRNEVPVTDHEGVRRGVTVATGYHYRGLSPRMMRLRRDSVLVDGSVSQQASEGDQCRTAADVDGREKSGADAPTRKRNG